MKTILHSADRRGHVSFGWLDSHHSFSFGNYYEPEKINFGMLRVLNDDVSPVDQVLEHIRMIIWKLYLSP